MLCDRTLSRTRGCLTRRSCYFLTPLVTTKDIVPFKYTSKAISYLLPFDKPLGKATKIQLFKIERFESKTLLRNVNSIS